MNADKIIGGIFENSPFFSAEPDGEEPIVGTLNLTGSRLFVITGENATGKSFLRRVISGRLRKNKVEAIGLSQEGRSSSGIASACIYGDEQWQSTGANSTHTLLAAFKTAKSREGKHAIIFDEPDIGLSDAYAAGAGIAISDFVRDIPSKTVLVAVMTHRKALVRQLLPANPSFIHLGVGGPASIGEWLDMEVVPKPISELPGRSHELFSKIHPILSRLSDKGRK